VIGFSMGGNWLGMALSKHKKGLEDKIVACACIQSPLKMQTAFMRLK
jgi:predicted alpha/beta-fold hydrolase